MTTIDHVVVKAGDSLTKIVARKQPGLNRAARSAAIVNLALANGMNVADRILPGQVLHYVATPVTAPPATGDRFTTVGEHIVDPAGFKFVPVGPICLFRARGYEPNPNWVTFANGHMPRAKADGWTIVRTTNGPPFGGSTLQAVIDGAKDAIDEITGQGLVALPCWWGGDTYALNSNPTWEQIVESGGVEFFDQIVDHAKGNPLVWLGLFDEIYDGDHLAEWESTFEKAYSRYRGRGWTNLISVGLPQWGLGIDRLAETSLGTDFVKGKTGVVFEWHNYTQDVDRLTGWVRAAQAKGLAVYMGEAGTHWDTNDHGTVDGMSVDHTRETLRWTKDNCYTLGIGYMPWVGTYLRSSEFSMRQGFGEPWYNDDLPLSLAGEWLRDVCASRPAPRRISVT